MVGCSDRNTLPSDRSHICREDVLLRVLFFHICEFLGDTDSDNDIPCTNSMEALTADRPSMFTEISPCTRKTMTACSRHLLV